MSERSIRFKEQVFYAADDITRARPLFRVKVEITEIVDNVLIKDYEIHWEES